MGSEEIDNVDNSVEKLEVGKLRKARGDIKRQLTSSEKLIASIDCSTDFEALKLEDRSEKHVKLWDKFDTIQTALDSILEDEAGAEAESEGTDFENRYHRICGIFKKYIKNPCFISKQPVSSVTGLNVQNLTIGNIAAPLLTPVYDPSSHIQSGDSSFSQQSTSSVNLPPHTPNEAGGAQEIPLISDESQNQARLDQDQLRFRARFQLPKLQTPTFYGSFDTWLTFHDSFKSMCHDNQEIPDIQKYHYLKACVKDEAAEVIASLETTGSNYQVAWELLKARYDNRKYIVESHVKALFDIPSMSKEFTVRALLDNFQKRIRAHRALKQPVDQWDTLLVFIIKEKLNHYTREKWEETVGSTNLPSLKDMISFLERRALIEHTQSGSKNNASNSNKTQPQKSNSNSRFHPRSSQACMATTVDSKTGNSQLSCHLCSGQHPLYSCEQFLHMSPPERYKVVKKTPLCHNCLLGNHRTVQCRHSSCRNCQQRHNTLLHFSQEKPVDTEASHTKITTALISFQGQASTQVVLGTAIIDILDSQGNYRPCRAFLDF